MIKFGGIYMKINPEKIMNINPRTTFEVKPLDINIAKAQYNLIERLEREVPEYGDFDLLLKNLP